MVMGQVGNGIPVSNGIAVPLRLPSLPSCPGRDRRHSLQCKALLCRGARGHASLGPEHVPGITGLPSMWFPSHGLMPIDDDPLEAFCTCHERQQMAQTPQSTVFINLLPEPPPLPFSPTCMSCTPARPLPSSAKCWITPTAG